MGADRARLNRYTGSRRRLWSAVPRARTVRSRFRDDERPGGAPCRPFGVQGGASYIRETMKVIDSLDIAKTDKEKICYRNAQALFKLQ